ncbi:MAG: hypothetical protein ACFFB5_22715 [Promethearchaeota archaeon]
MDKRSFFKILLFIGLAITIIGTFIHICCPTELDSTHFHLKSEEVYVKQIKMEKTIIGITYYLHLRINLHPNFNGTDYSSPDAMVLILNETEYLKFEESSSDLEELKPITTMERLDDSSGFTLNLELSHYFSEPIHLIFLISCSQTEPLSGNYYLGITASTYYLGIIIVVIGLIIVILTLIYWFSGWKRYLTLGISVNVLIFLFRILTIGKYNSIGMQYAFFGDLITPEMYNDFEFWYMSWLEPFLKGAFPYDSLYTPNLNEMFHYQMPPLFIITLGLFGLIPLLPGWKIAIPMFLSHIATGILVFLISYRNLDYSEEASTKVMLFYYLNPISLIYASFCWFNPPIFTFFVLITFYLITLENRELRIMNITVTSYDIALLTLGIATMYKQFAAVFFPMVIITTIKQRNISDRSGVLTAIIRYSMIFLTTILIIILPFIMIDFSKTVESILISTTEFGIWWTKRIGYSFPVNFNSFFVILGLPDIVTDLIGFLISYWILLGVSALTIYFLFWCDFDRSKIGENILKKVLFFWVLILVICVHLFYPRGTFKFYLILLIPFFSLNLNITHSFTAIDQSMKRTQSMIKKWYPISLEFAGYFLLLMIVVLINRYVYFMILLGLIIYIYVKKRKINLNNVVFSIE